MRTELHPYKKLFDEIRDRYLDIIRGLGLDMSIEGALSQLRDAIDSKRSAFAESRGEYIMALIMARLLDRPFVDAADIIKFERTGLNTQLTYDLIHERLKGLGGSVIPGYYGSMLCDKEVVLFARDGSDISGSLIARGIGADVYENWSDVPGAMTADPRIVKDAVTIPRMSHAELRELAAAGATVMHYAAVKPVMQARIPIHMRNTFDPDGAFTEVTTDAAHPTGTVISVASKRGFYALTVSDTGSYDTDDFMLKVTSILHELHVPIRHMSDGFDDVTILIDAIPESIEVVVGALREKLQDAEVIYQPAARIALIGEGMRGVPGFLGRVATALGANGVNIISPSQSATERSMIFAIAENDLEKATHALHTEFVEKLV
jgi:aspartate kinase